mgnify:CR=1 FL=1
MCSVRVCESMAGQAGVKDFSSHCALSQPHRTSPLTLSSLSIEQRKAFNLRFRVQSYIYRLLPSPLVVCPRLSNSCVSLRLRAVAVAAVAAVAAAAAAATVLRLVSL